MTELESAVMRRVAWRLVPFVSLAYLINVLDRFNISFAALTMNKALGLSATAYGLGAGAFFWSYVLFQVPANMVLERVGARRWIMGIMLFWGACSASMALVSGITSFVIVRFLLGVAEAGFFPGVAWFMTRWFPSRHRGKAMGVFYACGASAGIIGGPIAGNLLTLNGWLGIAGWQWIFLAEGLPAVLLALGCLMVLRDRPSDAAWLRPDECAWLEATLASERDAAAGRNLAFGRAVLTPTIVVLMLVYVLVGFGVYGKGYFLPLMIKTLGFTDLQVGYITSIPALAGVSGMIVFSRNSDRTGERVWHLIVPCLLGGIGLVLAGLLLHTSSLLAIASFSLASFGISGALPVFWNLPTAFLGTAAAAGGIAAINAVGNISGYAAPQLVGVLRDMTGGYELPMLVMGALVLIAGMLVPLARHAHVGTGATALAQAPAEGA
ncbi:MAG TPA: MFS transporter [Acetobacteraceae bacterium]|nr:MFS transporter [Acetobacteraceae bacterium]